jgi:hypothetical protein
MQESAVLHRQALSYATTVTAFLESDAFNVYISAAIGPVQWVVPALLACAALLEGAW